jgi:hypothetical protein
MTTRNRRPLGVLVLLLAAGGCNSSGLVNATGRLTYKGQPVPSTYVIFQPDEDGVRSSQGLTDADGNFKLLSSTTASGVFPGHYTVVLKYYLSADEEVGKTPPKASRQLQAVLVKYGDPKTSPLKYEVKKGGQVFEIEIE